MALERLCFVLDWLRPHDEGEPLTTADLSVRVDGEAIWPAHGEASVWLEIQADDLLSYLTEFWKPLMLRQTYPISVTPERPSLLRAEAEKRWATEPTPVVEREAERVAAFEEAHDLSRCFAGMFGLPALWLLRTGDYMVVETASDLCRVPFVAARDALVAAGDKIADRLAESQDERWSDLIGAWRKRDQGPAALLLAWSASLSRDVAEEFVKQRLLSAPSNVLDAANDDDELRIAARMASALPFEQIGQVIRLVRELPKRGAPGLDDLSRRVRGHVEQRLSDRRPYEQGEASASFVREQLGFALGEFIEVFAVVEKLGLKLYLRRVEPSTLDALAVWGPGHGPAVLLNRNSRRVSGRGDLRRTWAARVTLAHELCHLLLDRGHALSAVDVLDSRMPLEVERRAKSFAGEFLLPGRVAADIWTEAGRPRAPDRLRGFLGQISRRFGVTGSVAAWKLEHGLHHQNIDLRPLLDLIVPQR